jgi:hypothetical protein
LAAGARPRQAGTVLAWHRRGFRLFWTWKSRHRTGRPAAAPEVRALIRRMSSANPLWGAPRIHGELQKLGITVSQSQATSTRPEETRTVLPINSDSIRGPAPRGTSTGDRTLIFSSVTTNSDSRLMLRSRRHLLGSHLTRRGRLNCRKRLTPSLLVPHLHPTAELIRSRHPRFQRSSNGLRTRLRGNELRRP